MMKFSPVAYAKSHIPPPGHQRTYVLGYSIAMMANGVFLPIYVLYVTRIVGISTSKTALAASIAALVGLPITLVAGDFADRLGPRRVVLVGLGGQALGIAGYVFIQGFWSLLAVGMGMNLFAYAYFASEGALMRRVGGENTIAFRSQVQVLGSIGLTAGAAGAGIGLAVGTPWAFRAMFLSVAAVYLVVMAITLRIPDYKPLPRPKIIGQAKDSHWIVLRDKPFIAYALVAAGLAISSFVVHQLLPVWIVGHTSAPRWTISLAFVINTGIGVMFQMRLSKNIRSTRQGGRALLRCGITLMLGCVVLAAMRGHSPWVATVLVIAGISLLSIASIWQASGQFVLEFNLPPAHAQGQYDGLLNTVGTLSVATAPLVLLGEVAGRGFAGWIGLGLFFLLLGFIGPAIAAWGERTRPQAAPPAQATIGAGGTVAVEAGSVEAGSVGAGSVGAGSVGAGSVGAGTVGANAGMDESR